MKKALYLVLLAIAMSFSMSCQQSEEEKLSNMVDSFAVNYFNWRYDRCMTMVTPESEKLLRFQASNVTELDIDALRSVEEGAGIEFISTSYESDTVFSADIIIFNFLLADAVGSEPKLYSSAETTIKLVKREGKWLVDMANSYPFRMANLLQNETQDRASD